MNETLRALLQHAKRPPEVEVTWKALRDNVLGTIYHAEMRLKDVMVVVLNAYEQAASDPRFELAYRHEPMRHLMMAPLEILVNPWTRADVEDRMTVEGFYNMILEKLMIELRMVRVDWCAEWYKGETDVYPAKA